MFRFVAFTALTLASAGGAAEEIYPGYTWQSLGDGIYVHAQIDPLAAPVDGNSVVIVNDDGILVVDTGINPAVAREVVAKIRSVSDKPVTHVVNTHWHDDHTNGNYVYRAAYPDAQFLAHRETLRSLREEWQDMENQRMDAYAAVDTDALRQTADSLEVSEPDTAIGYRVYAGYVDALRPELPELELVYPDTVFSDRLVYDFGNRTVQLLWLGRGNTAGDVVVWLEEEQVLLTGDLLVAPVPFAFDSPMVDWIETLGRMAALDAATIVPGHGPVQHDRRYLAQVRALLESTVGAVRAAHEDGTAYDELAGAIDLDAHRQLFTGDDPERDWAWQAYFVTPGVKSAWTSLGYPLPGDD